MGNECQNQKMSAENDTAVVREEAEGRQAVMRLWKEEEKKNFLSPSLSLITAAWRECVPFEHLDTIWCPKYTRSCLVSAFNIKPALLKC